MRTPLHTLWLLAVLTIGVLPVRLASVAPHVANCDGVGTNWGTDANWSGGIATAQDGTAVIVLSGTIHLIFNVAVPRDAGPLAFGSIAGALK